MHATLDPNSQAIWLAAQDRPGARAFFEDARKQGAFLLELGWEPKALATSTFQVRAGEDDLDFTFEARVVQIFPGGTEAGGWRTVFELSPWPESKRLELERKLAAVGASTGPAAGAGETLGASPLFRIKAMDPNQRMRLAMQAGRIERQILRQDGSPQVLMGLLANPRSEAEDVLAVVRSTLANGAILKRVAEDPRWSKNPEIRTAVVRNPHTPSPLAIQLLDTLPISELRTMAKMGALRENVRKAALRIYLKRLGK